MYFGKACCIDRCEWKDVDCDGPAYCAFKLSSWCALKRWCSAARSMQQCTCQYLRTVIFQIQEGLLREFNPGFLAHETRIKPLDQAAIAGMRARIGFHFDSTTELKTLCLYTAMVRGRDKQCVRHIIYYLS